MAFWDSLINGLKSKNNVQQDNVMSGGIDQNVTPPDNTNNSGNIQDNVKKTNAIVNVLKNAAPTNWSDETRQKVLLASKFLSGFGGTQYNPNENMLGNIANGMSNGANAAFQQMQNYNNYKNTKSLYEQMGLDTTGLNPVGDYSSMTPAQVISLGIRQKQNNIRQEIANANDKTKRLTLIMNNYNKGSISADEAQKLMQMYGLDISDLQESNETKKTNSQIELNNTRKKYIEETASKSNMDRTELNKEKTGCLIEGIKAINPINGKEVPIFLGDFVLGSYGTGAVMAVPAHDQRDFEYAKAHNLDMLQVIDGRSVDECAFEKQDYLGKGCKLINSEEFTGMTVEEAKEAITEKLVNRKIARKVNNYKMRDWIFSRQRFWGEPIPMIYCEKCGWQPMDEKDLPLVLPNIAEYEPTEDGESPLAKIEEWVNCECPKCGGKAKRETDTMPNWAGSSWYFLRFMDPHNDHEFASMDAMKYWSRVDWYNGGMEHTARHLLYARFWVQFLYNIGLVPNKEMIWTRISHGMILGDNNEKMSKSRGNVVNPDDMVKAYGADALRVYEMFIGDYEKDAAWNENGLKGCKRFIDKVYRLKDKVNDSEEYSDSLVNIINKTIKKVTDDIDTMNYNTAVSALMILANQYDKEESISRKDYKALITLLNPIAPHITEELNEMLNLGKPICESEWLTYDESKIVDDTVNIACSVNGKLRSTISVQSGLSRDELLSEAKKQENVIKYIEGHEIIKEIVVPDKIVNIVVK